MNELKVFAGYNVCHRAFELFVRHNDGRLGVMELVDGLPENYPNPTLRIDAEPMQEFFDRLWSLGCRPTEIGSAGCLAATERHLEDMRQIAFNKLSMEKPCPTKR